jgi:cyclic beta-1,2-glucan synthetase
MIATRLKNRLQGKPPSHNDGENGESRPDGERPFRSELYSIGQLERHAKLLAGWHRLSASPQRDRLVKRLDENDEILSREYEQLIGAVRRGARVSPAAEWFLDNYYLIEEQIRTARLHLPKRYQRQLPQLANGPSAGCPRVYDIALELISHVDGRVEAQALKAFVAAYQTSGNLRLGELWAIPIMLRLALLENIRRVVLRLAANRAEAERANDWVAKMLETRANDSSKVIVVLAEMVSEDKPLTNEFIAAFANRLHVEGAGLVFPMSWLEQRLAEQGRTMEHILQEASQNHAADQVSIGNSISSLRFLTAMDWREFVESTSPVEYTLRRDPAGAYPEMDFATRDNYRHAVEEIARYSLASEDEVAAQAVELAEHSAQEGERTRHVGYYLVNRGRRQLERIVGARVSLGDLAARWGGRFPLGVYAGLIGIVLAILMALSLWWTRRHGLHGPALIAVGALLLLCLSGPSVALVQWIATMIVRPRLLPRMDYSKKGIPANCRTIVVVPTLLVDDAETDSLLEELEIRFLANRDPRLLFALVTDFRDAPQEKMPADDAILEHAKKGIADFNEKYGGGFYLLHRSRLWNERERKWMGWERKRGKLEDLNGFLRGKHEKFSTVVGNVDGLNDVRYVITLDTDTQLPRDSARLLVGTIAHPLNQPRYDERLGRVTEGYGILQPLVADNLPGTGRSRFAQLFRGEVGIDPYTRAVSDVYQDICAEGSFVGKGIYDIDAFEKAVGGRFPENRILSHDLIESAYVRSGLVSDVVLLEESPSAYSVEVSRRHRWIRGDWQIAQWLLPLVPGTDGKWVRNPISALSRWKILDNLRRSLLPVAAMILLITGWLLPGDAIFYTILALAMFFLPSILSGLEQVTRRSEKLPTRLRLKVIVSGIMRQVVQESLLFACLPYDALINLDAIVRVWMRLLITRRRLLEWQTARDAHRAAAGGNLPRTYLAMWIQPGAAILIAIGPLLLHRPILAVADVIAGFWLIAPGVVWWLGRTMEEQKAELSDADLAFLRILTRRTWRFFETFIAAADNYLPPDNFQEDPPQGIAHRTSPTNIGLCLLSNLAAYDFGYIPAGRMLERCGQTIATMEKMTRHRGHFFNWYDTRTLEPLNPRYISTVDSGNLSAHLLVLAAACDGLDGETIIAPTVFEGLGATIEAALHSLGETISSGPVQNVVSRLRQWLTDLKTPPTTLSAAHTLLLRIAEESRSLSPAQLGELKWWIGAIADQCQAFADELSGMAPWVNLTLPADLTWHKGDLQQLLRKLNSILTLAETAGLEMSLLAGIDSEPESVASSDWFAKLRAAVATGAENAAARMSLARQTATRCRELAETELEFLYDPGRRLLSIGYNVTEHRVDGTYYDLLASEARVASFIGIAQGKLPQEHWFSLSRILTSIHGHAALLSWSGSMFEYLMPLVFMPTHRSTLMDETYMAVVRRQIEYGKEREVPWGISEAGYSKTDAQLNYQYSAFGVPGLGFKRGLGDELVIAPYASVMALMVDAESSSANLRAMAAAGRMGQYGFYEALDYTTSRLPPGQACVVVRSYMAHHQGMSFLSLAYLLLEQPMQRRFRADPFFRATELLLHERVPKTPLVYPHPAEISEAAIATAETQPVHRTFNTPDTPVPEVQLLSNGRYHVVVTAAGGGYSRWRDLSVTRWREDAVRDCWGSFCYVRDVGSGEFWSAAHQPTLKRPQSYEAIFSQGRAEFRRRDADLENKTYAIDTRVEIAVSPEDDIELRRLTITNRSQTRRVIELTSFAEVVIAPQTSDTAHPAFSNLFVRTQILRIPQAILCTRRQRSPAERPPWMMHLMTVEGTPGGETSYETGRLEFIGRGRDASDPAAMHRPNLTNTEGAVLDPIAAIRNTVILEPDQVAHVNIVTGMAETEQAAKALIEKYHDPNIAQRVFELAWTHSQVIAQQLDTSEGDIQLFSRLASSIIYSNPLLRAPGSVIARNRRGQSGLWGYGISGDLPIVLLRIGDQSRIHLVRELVTAHAYWRVKGLATDLIIWNEDPSGYRQALQDTILSIVSSRAASSLLDKPGGIFVRRGEQISEDDKVLMQSVARAIITDTAGTLGEQTARRATPSGQVPRFNPIRRRKQETLVGVEIPQRELVAFNGLGGFTSDGREYVITIKPDHPTPAPWVNVLANPNFGTVVSESGAAYTWCENAQAFRLTPWNNDWITDSCGEAFYVRDEESGRFFSPCPKPAPGPWPYTTRHGFGYTIFEYSDGDIVSEMLTFVATDAPVKFVTLKLRNNSGRARRMSVTGFFDLVLGDQRSANLANIVTESDPKTGALFARNSFHVEFPHRVEFLDCSQSQRTVTGDRLEFLGRNGRPMNPAAMSRLNLSGRVGAGLDPCAAMQCVLELAAGQESEVTFIFGSGRDLADARNLIARFRGVEPAHAALGQVWDYWKRTLGVVYVETPDPTFNFLVNGWLLYQTLACRFWARTGYYQSSGAFGFRDQLQDSMALIHAEPALLRAHLLRCAVRQYKEGDVQHWWHPPTGRGVRTRMSDDYLWLPYAVCRYVSTLGDTGVLDEQVPFLEGRPVKPDEDSYYELPTRSEESASLYEHCVRAIKNGLRFGEHGLPLMGAGDWNDGMNLVGDKGKGESIWLAFFLHDVLKQFALVARNRRDIAFAELCTAEAGKLRQNIEQHAWDGQWYRRAYFDNGEPLGSSTNPECKIDSLPQSWSILSGAGLGDRPQQALEQLNAMLVNRDLKVIQLLDPPFDHSELNPGYIKGYVPGVRENGGQYTHAAVWAVMAFAQAGDSQRAWELFNFINPVRHGDSEAAIRRYKIEPYVVAGDVYTNIQHAGRGGWSWYTGAAGWMYRLATESLLGLHLEVDHLRITPLMPEKWESLTIHYRYRDTFYHIQVHNLGGGQTVRRVTVEGVDQPELTIPLVDDRHERKVEIEIGAARPRPLPSRSLPPLETAEAK